MPTYPAHQQPQQYNEQSRWELRQVIDEIRGFGQFKFQIPEERRPGIPAKIKGIVTPVQPQTKVAQKHLMAQRELKK